MLSMVCIGMVGTTMPCYIFGMSYPDEVVERLPLDGHCSRHQRRALEQQATRELAAATVGELRDMVPDGV